MDFSFVDTIFDPLEKRPVKRWVLELPGAGCEWYKESGGCTMCAFSQSTQKFTFGGKLYPPFLFWLFFHYAYSLVKKANPELLVIYNGGSFPNDKEIPHKTQLAILDFVAKHPTIKKILVESRADLITAEKMAEYNYHCGNGPNRKKLEIALGLESSNDEVRNGCLRKGLSKKAFENAVAQCRYYGIEVFAYAYLKSHCLNEDEAIKDAIETIRYCFAVGVNEVSLSCAFVQENTILSELYHKGKFLPPKLWSIIQVIKETASLGPVRIGHFDDTPPPIAIPHNYQQGHEKEPCPLCNDQVMKAIAQYRETHDIKVFDGLKCVCQD